MSTFRGTTKIPAPVSPTSPSDTYPSHMALWGQGGFRSVDTIVSRDGISTLRREEGMKVFVIETDTEYRLKGGILNENWIEVTTSGGGDTNYRILDSLSELEAIPASARQKGLSVYVKDVDQEYRLMKGIDNIHWVLVSDPVLVNIGGEVQEPGTTVTNEFITNNTYENKLGCLNKSLMQNTILTSIKSNFGNYIDEGGAIIATADENNEFTFIMNNETFWIDDSIYFKVTANIDSVKLNELFLNIEENGIDRLINLTEAIQSGTEIPGLKLYGNAAAIIGYMTFSDYGQKNIRVYQEDDHQLVKNINKSIYIFSQNFVIKDGESLTPFNIIESDLSFTKKSYNFAVPVNAQYNIGLAKVNVSELGIDITDFTRIPNTTYNFTTSGSYTIDLDRIRSTLVDGTYALIVTGTENNIAIPNYFYGPFTIDLQ